MFFLTGVPLKILSVSRSDTWNFFDGIILCNLTPVETTPCIYTTEPTWICSSAPGCKSNRPTACEVHSWNRASQIISLSKSAPQGVHKLLNVGLFDLFQTLYLLWMEIWSTHEPRALVRKLKVDVQNIWRITLCRMAIVEGPCPGFSLKNWYFSPMSSCSRS